ncbi:hypothetical protein [Elioraea sp.]|uniref:hypothetical protein n=1 Tax=Elioraea sp. TaxID=2185103 RepID=UPI0025B88063|nr:hypothetical protein [Elioraea sp.]
MSNIHVARAISPVSVADNTDQVSQIIDRQGYGSLTFVIATGSIADADVTFTVLVEHSDASNMSGGVPVPDDDLIGTEALAAFVFNDDDEVRKIGYRGARRYVRMTITPVGNASAAVLAAVAILGHAEMLPRANPPV